MTKNIALEKRFLTASELEKLTPEELYKYCFIPGNKEDWDTDFNKELVNNIEHYALLKTLSGVPLSYIKTKIDMTMSDWLPEGTKLNPRLSYAIQSILEQNKEQTRTAALTKTANAFIAESCTSLTTIINKAFDYSVEQ